MTQPSLPLAQQAIDLDHALGNVLTVVVGNLVLLADDLETGRAGDPALAQRALAAARRGTEALEQLRRLHGVLAQAETIDE